MNNITLLLFSFFIGNLFGLNAQVDSLYLEKHLITGKDTLPYRMLLPVGFSKHSRYPLILFLHGAGERGDDNTAQLTHGATLFTRPEIRQNFPAIVIFPQCPIRDYWASVEVDRSSYPIGLDFNYDNGPTKAMSLVMDLLEVYLNEEYVNTERVYLMGLSMGGMGAFELLARRPGVFAAAVAICGAGEPEKVGAYAAHLPVWVFHGTLDNVVSPIHSMEMVSAILAEGGHPRFTLYDTANHNSWDPAFAEPDLLPWLFSHQNKPQ